MISLGYPPDYVWRLTPKRIDATLFVARKRVNMQRLEELAVAQMARTTDKDRLSQFVKALNQ